MKVNGATRKTVVITVGLLLVASIGISPVVSAAGQTELVVTPTKSIVETGETTTVDVVLGSASGGVGAAEMRVAVDDPAVASITDVTIRGEPGLTDVTSADDGSWVDVAYATANTDDSGSVTVVTVTIEGEADGTTGISILPMGDRDTVVAYDEEGTGYDLSSVGGSEITVRDVDDDDDDDRDNDGGSADQTETPAEPTATATPAQTTEAPGTGEDDPAQSTTTSTAPADDGDDSDGEETATTSPGFGLALAVVALLAAALLAGRRD